MQFRNAEEPVLVCHLQPIYVLHIKLNTGEFGEETALTSVKTPKFSDLYCIMHGYLGSYIQK